MALTKLQLLQKRARDKEYKLRRKGASPEELAKVSPRKDWAAVQAMTPAQRRSYAKKLEQFNARKNRLYVLKDRSIMTDKQVKQYEGYYKEVIKRDRKLAAQVDRMMNKPGAERLKKAFLAEMSRDPITGKPIYKGQDLTPQYKKPLPPETKRGLQWRMTDTRKPPISQARRRAIARANMVKQLNYLGMEDMARYVKNMTRERFDVLSVRTDIWDKLALTYMPAESQDPDHPGMTALYEDEISVGGADAIAQRIFDAGSIGRKDIGRYRSGLRQRYKRYIGGLGD